MKAVQISRYGGSEVVEIKHNIPSPSVPKPLPDKILVDIKAAGVNPVDWKIREGHMQQMMNPKFPLTLGMDFSCCTGGWRRGRRKTTRRLWTR